jgi:hypothetical protein
MLGKITQVIEKMKTDRYRSLMSKIIVFIIICISTLGVRAETEYIQLSKIKLEKRTKIPLAQMSKLEFFLSNIKKIDKNYEKLEKRMRSNEIVGLELLVADTTKKDFESRWGHALFRFVDINRKAANDLVVGYVAQVDSPGLSYFKGLFGGYALVPELRPLREFHQQYAAKANRHLDRFLFSSDKMLRKNLFLKLKREWLSYRSVFLSNLEIQKTRALKKAKKYAKKKRARVQSIVSLYGKVVGLRVVKDKKNLRVFPIKFKLRRSKIPQKYTFLRNNCSGAIVKLLRSAGLKFLPRFSFNSIIPVKLDDFLAKHHLIHFKLPRIPTVQEVSNFPDKSFLDLKKMKGADVDDYIKENASSLSDTQRYIILDQFNLEDNLIDEISSFLSVSVVPTYESIYHLKSNNSYIYNLCLDKRCRVKSEEGLIKIYKKRKKKYSSKKTTFFVEKLLLQTEIMN